MKILVADTDRNSLVSVVKLLEGAGFSCETTLISKKGADTVPDKTPGAFDAAVFGPEMRLPLKKQYGESLLKNSFPVLFMLKKEDAPFPDSLPLLTYPERSDFVLFPARSGELSSRLGILLKRAYPERYQSFTYQKGPFFFSRFPDRLTKDGKEIPLTRKEFETAYFLFRHFGRPLSRLTIEEAVWPEGTEDASRTADTHISRVRKKLGLTGAGFVLKQIYGYGYQLAAAGE